MTYASTESRDLDHQIAINAKLKRENLRLRAAIPAVDLERIERGVMEGTRITSAQVRAIRDEVLRLGYKTGNLRHTLWAKLCERLLMQRGYGCPVYTLAREMDHASGSGAKLIPTYRELLAELRKLQRECEDEEDAALDARLDEAWH